MKILIADDNHIERLILSKVIENLGHHVILAEDGEQAVIQFNQHQPDFVFLDVLMPKFDGYEVARIIKKENTQSWFPIIFLTSLTEASDLAKCIESGGDDFVSKPINKVIIQAKIAAFERIINLYSTVDDQKAKIQFHHRHLVQEQEAAKRIFNNIVHRGSLESDNINYHLSPMSIFNGDLMLAAELPMGGMRLMLADFTGHGLPAAIGAMPASEIFYGMTAKGFSIRGYDDRNEFSII
ncbi:MAG: response regulator [Enterobacterales bacterium]|nr:response regulator [Enterobacterales bacterium]